MVKNSVCGICGREFQLTFPKILAAVRIPRSEMVPIQRDVLAGDLLLVIT
ncbi:MAG: hypothetical protein WCO08_08130 [Actinomycetes bacterium]